MDKFSAVKIGGYRLGDFKSKSAAMRAIKQAEPGFYQIIANYSIGGYYGLAVWEGNHRK